MNFFTLLYFNVFSNTLLREIFNKAFKYALYICNSVTELLPSPILGLSELEDKFIDYLLGVDDRLRLDLKLKILKNTNLNKFVIDYNIYVFNRSLEFIDKVCKLVREFLDVFSN